MKRFRWNKSQSETAVIHMVIIRMRNRQITIEEALQQTIPKHSQNPEAIPDKTLKSLRKQVETKLKGGKSNAQANHNFHAAQ